MYIYAYPYIHEFGVNPLWSAMKSDRFYKCLANETRLRCMMLLMARGELCVCDIAESLGTSQPMISRHLAQLRACDLVSDHRQGQWVYYRLHPGLLPWQLDVLALTREALETESSTDTEDEND